jgi:hypothetical protein
MQPIAPDYKAPEPDDLPSVADGTYSIEAINFMEKSIDKATKKPILLDSSFGPTVYFDLSILGNDDETIPLSCRIHELPHIVQAFTGKAGELLPPVPALDQVGAIETYLMLAAQLANEGTLRPTMTVKKGWGSAYRFSGSQIPVGSYHGYFTDILTKNAMGLPAHNPSDRYPDQHQFDGLFLIVANQYGEQCGWSGVSVMQKFMQYKATTVTDENGQLKPDWVRGPKTGEYTQTAKNFSIFVGTTAPSLFANGTPQFADPANMCPEWLISVQQDRVLLNLSIKANKSGYPSIDIEAVMAADPSRLCFDIARPTSIIDSPPKTPSQPPVNAQIPQTPVPQNVPTVSNNHLQVLCDLLNVFTSETEQFRLPFPSKAAMYTEEQKDVILRYIAPLKEQLSTAVPNKMTLGDVGIIFENLPYEEWNDKPDLSFAVSQLYTQLEADEEAPF